ncbi:MAG: sugar phosphate isomerase/epimerase, partial [Promethearchaeota archaeon]
FTVHAKDTIIYKDKLAKLGILEPGWWEFKLPGLGVIDWQLLFEILKKNGFNGAVNVEHEDSQYRSTKEKIQEGFLLGVNHLRKCL